MRTLIELSNEDLAEAVKDWLGTEGYEVDGRVEIEPEPSCGDTDEGGYAWDPFTGRGWPLPARRRAHRRLDKIVVAAKINDRTGELRDKVLATIPAIAPGDEPGPECGIMAIANAAGVKHTVAKRVLYTATRQSGDDRVHEWHASYGTRYYRQDWSLLLDRVEGVLTKRAQAAKTIARKLNTTTALISQALSMLRADDRAVLAKTGWKLPK